MNKRLLTALGLAALGLLTACSDTQAPSASRDTPAPPAADGKAHFAWLEYSGDDELFKLPLGDNQYRNPILAGYYPDPSVVRVGEDFYMVNSTFGFFPGVPVFHSRDLVNWTQLSNAVHRPEQMSFDGINLGNNGIYAPAIEYRDGTFYVITTCVACGHNFVVTATNPAGPWSDPIWLPHLQGIDPSIFFDDDGKTYIVHHRDPDNKRYPAHTALWVMEVDPVTFAPLSDDVMLVDGGDEAPWNTEYIEGPHIYKVNGTYYLSAPGGGTGYYHQQLLYKSANVFGPYEPNPNNPVLTQYGLPDDREFPVTATGHADMVDDGKGNWWAVFLGTRVYDLNKPNQQDPGNFHTGRETFLLPVTWQDGWPVILEKGKALPNVAEKPNLPTAAAARPLTGNYSLREEFTDAELGLNWQFIRTPRSQWWQTGNGELVLEPRTDRLGDYNQPSFTGIRLAHMNASISTQVQFVPQASGDAAGLLALQNDEFFFSFALSQNAEGKPVVRVRKRAGKDDPIEGKTLIEQAITITPGEPVYLRMSVNKAKASFAYSLDGKTYSELIDGISASPLTTAAAGGFTGALVGPFAEKAQTTAP